MKKILLPIAFMAIGVFAFNASAQENGCKHGKACCKTEQTCCKAKKGAKAARPDLFAGITLSAEQQAQVNALQAEYAKKAKDAKQAKADGKKKELAQAQESRKKYLEDMKKILTPEQYTVFLENQALAKSHGPKMKGKHAAKKGERKGKASKPADKAKQTQSAK